MDSIQINSSRLQLTCKLTSFPLESTIKTSFPLILLHCFIRIPLEIQVEPIVDYLVTIYSIVNYSFNRYRFIGSIGDKPPPPGGGGSRTAENSSIIQQLLRNPEASRKRGNESAELGRNLVVGGGRGREGGRITKKKKETNGRPTTIGAGRKASPALWPRKPRPLERLTPTGADIPRPSFVTRRRGKICAAHAPPLTDLSVDSGHPASSILLLRLLCLLLHRI